MLLIFDAKIRVRLQTQKKSLRWNENKKKLKWEDVPKQNLPTTFVDANIKLMICC